MSRRRTRDKIWMKPAEGECQVHDLPTEGLAKVVVKLMREKHGQGGVNVCVDCLKRAKTDASPKCPNHGDRFVRGAEMSECHVFYCVKPGCDWEMKLPKPKGRIPVMTKGFEK